MMKNTLALLFLISLFPASLFSQDNIFSQYKRHTEEKIIYEKIQKIRIKGLSKQELPEYLKKWDSITHINFEVAKQFNITHDWYLLDEYDIAINHNIIAFNKGYDIEHLRAENVRGIRTFFCFDAIQL